MPPRQSFLLLAVLACVVLMLPHTSASSCTALVKEYLHEIHASRRPVSKRVDAAREHFNEVRTSGTSGEADARAKLQEAEKALAAFDAAVVDKYGRHLPRTCIDELQEEVQALPPLNSDHVLLLAFQGMHRVLWYHLRLHWNILRGVMDHNLHGWYPMLDRFRLSCNAFFDKAHDCYDLAHPLDASGQRHTLPSTLHVVLYSVQGMAYACVPLILGAVLLVSLAMLAIPAGVVLILPDLIYQIWGRIFFAAFTFGLTAQGAVWAAMMEYVAMLMGGELTEMKDRLLDALEALVAESSIKFYNGIVAAFTLIYPLMMIGVVLLSWILTRCCHRD